ncbi:hypothetical protein [Ensifer sesbaniae]|uniref:hypothetical protein n=1 Tax=Ensifer sesbaniae TaxID=1214071 RepID=UPI00156A4A2C|nr:hypothetical protein [Ensifer sesbaniae]NRQ15040.1 hypothetical protein [Ensifer sesbaniae]
MSSRLVFSLFLVALSVVLVWAFRPPQGNAGGRPAMPHVAEQGQVVNPDCGLG